MKPTAIVCQPAPRGCFVCATDCGIRSHKLIVVGEGLAAGIADYSLSLKDVYQDKSFPAQMARQMNTGFPQPLIQPPGIGNVPGFPAMPVRLPGVLAGLDSFAVPGYHLCDEPVDTGPSSFRNR